MRAVQLVDLQLSDGVFERVCIARIKIPLIARTS